MNAHSRITLASIMNISTSHAMSHRHFDLNDEISNTKINVIYFRRRPTAYGTISKILGTIASRLNQLPNIFVQSSIYQRVSQIES